ncbi:hypothetical protein D3C87_1649370 [compost metagenome]
MGIGTIQNGKIIVVISFGTAFLNDGFSYDFTFFIICESTLYLNAVAGLIVGEDILFQLIFIVGDNAIGNFYNILGRAVILL